MNDTLQLRPAREADLPCIMQIIAQAKAQMKALGSTQWQEGYPCAEDIARDLMCEYGWVVEQITTKDAPTAHHPVVAYAAVVYDGEQAYEQLEGKWLTDADYVAVHRLAVADAVKRRGVATELMRRIGEMAAARGVRAFRVDTNFDNRYMLRLFDRLGFVYCGKVHYQSGERMAFERIL